MKTTKSHWAIFSFWDIRYATAIKKVLIEYWKLHIEASNEFQIKKKSGFNFQKAKSEYMKKRLNSYSEGRSYK